MTRELVDWYWSFGQSRTGAYELSSQWLASVYRNAAVLESCGKAEKLGRMSVGVWGPSQSGKSTLISGLCDKNAGVDGGGGALDWGTPVRFSSDDAVPPGVVVFNPHNLGSDASGCVSRFVQTDRVDDPTAPVTIDLLNRKELMHALAAGYSSECRIGPPITKDRLEEIVKSVCCRQNAAPQREAFEALVELCDVIELLVHADDERFKPTTDVGFDISERLLSDRGLVSDVSTVRALASRMLWDDHSAVTGVFEALLKLRSALPSGNITCSMEVAALLVNIESYKTFLDNVGSAAATPSVKQIVRAINGLARESTPKGFRIVVGNGGMFSSAAEFGWFQGLIRELTIPLRRGAIEGEGESRFFDVADLVDFPGVPNEDRNAAEKQISLDDFESEGDRGSDPILLTKVLKRGKVASLVVGYGRSMQLDAFLLLARAGGYPAKPGRLHKGITSWWKSFDPSYDVYDAHAGRPPLPVFFNLTFFGKIIDLVAQGAATSGMQPLVQMIEQLDPLVAPEVSTLLITTYKKFREGQIHLGAAKSSEAVEVILKDESFGKRLINPDSLASLRKVLNDEDGGVSHLFSVLGKSLQPSNRTNKLSQRKSFVLKQILNLLSDCVPGSGDERLKRDLMKLKECIAASIEAGKLDTSVLDPVARTSLALRRIVDIPGDDLDFVPPAGSDRVACERYVIEQLKKWANRERDIQHLKIEKPVLKRILNVLASSVTTGEIASWIHSELPQQRTTEDCKELRTAVSANISRTMLRGDAGRTRHPEHGSAGSIASLVKEWADAEASGRASATESPHYVAIIAPIEERLEALANGRLESRPDQAGDDQIVEIYESMVARR